MTTKREPSHSVVSDAVFDILRETSADILMDARSFRGALLDFGASDAEMRMLKVNLNEDVMRPFQQILKTEEILDKDKRGEAVERAITVLVDNQGADAIISRSAVAHINEGIERYLVFLGAIKPEPAYIAKPAPMLKPKPEAKPFQGIPAEQGPRFQQSPNLYASRRTPIRKRHRVILRGFLVLFLLIIVGAFAYAYYSGYGWPLQEDVVEGLFITNASGGDIRSFLSGSLSDETFMTIKAVLPNDATSVFVQGVDRSMNESFVFVRVTLAAGGERFYYVLLERKGISWQVTDVIEEFPALEGDNPALDAVETEG